VSLLVIDASVAAKWLLPAAGEPWSDEALDLVVSYARGDVRLMVPDLFWAELANILWKAVRQGRLTRTTAEAGLAATRDRNLPTIPSLEVLDQAFAIAATFDRSVYDSLYVALAVEMKAQLITADQKLAHALAAHLPVKWLGAC
jgi:predicted nucleic acid-binding protein